MGGRGGICWPLHSLCMREVGRAPTPWGDRGGQPTPWGLVQGVGDLSGHFWALPPPPGAMQAAVSASTTGLKLVSGPSCPPSAPFPKQTTARSPSDRAIGWAAGPGGYVSACWLRLFHGLAASQPRLAALAQWVGASSGPRELLATHHTSPCSLTRPPPTRPTRLQPRLVL